MPYERPQQTQEQLETERLTNEKLLEQANINARELLKRYERK
jgi:hypothetical protein